MLSSIALLSIFPAIFIKTVPYSTVDGVTLQMDVYAPAHIEPLPAVIVIHGGAWVTGDRSDMSDLCYALARNDMIAMTIDYRLAPQSKWPAMLEDSQAALQFAKTRPQQFGVDPDRIAVAGASAGGHLALLLGMMDETAGDVDAVLNLFGPTDLSKDFSPFLMAAMADQLLGKSLVDAESEIMSMSPVSYASAGDAPVFTVHGTDDPLVPHKQSERLDEIHPSHVLLSINGMVHGIDVSKHEEVNAVIDGIEFLIEKLGS